jgi:hypothetical protein
MAATTSPGDTRHAAVNRQGESDDAVIDDDSLLDLCRRDDNPMVGAIIGGSPQSAAHS